MGTPPADEVFEWVAVGEIIDSGEVWARDANHALLKLRTAYQHYRYVHLRVLDRDGEVLAEGDLAQRRSR